MNINRVISAIVISIILASASVAIIPTIEAVPTFHVIQGTLYIGDDEVAGAGIDIKFEVPELSFESKIYQTFEQDPNGYNFLFDALDHATYGGKTVHFKVKYEGSFVSPIDNKSIVLDDDISYPVAEYILDLHIDTPANNPPNTPSSPSPADDDTGIGTGASLSWTGGDPDGDPVTYDVYFGTTNPPPKIEPGNQSGATYAPSLGYSTKYYWQIVAWDEHGATSSGPIWSFTTAAYTPPYDPPYNPPYNPPDTNQNPTADANGPYSGFIDEEITFDGSNSSDSDGTITNYTWDFGDNTTGYGVNPTHTYDTSGEYTTVLTVTDNDEATDTDETTVNILVPNIPPEKPTVTGTHEGNITTTYEFTFMSTDDDGDNVSYYIEWGDGQTNETAFVPNGTQVTLTHTWSVAGNYTIIVTAYDNDTHSDIAEYLVSIEAEQEPEEPEPEGYDYTCLILVLILIIILLIVIYLLSKRKKPEEKKQPPKKTENNSKKPAKKTGKTNKKPAKKTGKK